MDERRVLFKEYRLFIACLIFICGIVFAASRDVTSHPAHSVIATVVILFACLILSLKRDVVFFAVLLLLVFALGAVRYSVYNTRGADDISRFTRPVKKNAVLEGVVKSDPETSPTGTKQTFVLDVDSILRDGKRWRTTGRVLVSLFQKDAGPFRYGDRVRLEGNLQRPFSYAQSSRFDYRAYLARRRIHSVLNVRKGALAEKTAEDRGIPTRLVRAILSVRTALDTLIAVHLDPPYGPVLATILLGKRKGVPPWLRRLFARTGTLHILAISGLHVGILYFALRIMLKILRCNRTLSVVLSVFALIFFALLTGARPPIVRATVMFCILAASELLRRKVGILNVVGLSCLGMLFVNPCQVFDVGFIFSYTAVVSIIILSPGLQSALMARGTFGPDRAAYRKAYFALARSLSVSLGAWIGLLPLIAYYFGMITPVIVIANLFAVPLVALVMGSGLIFLLFGSFLRFCAPLFAQSTWFFIFVLTDGLKFLGRIPFGSFTVPHWSRSGVCVYYASILLIICVARVKKLTICFLT